MKKNILIKAIVILLLAISGLYAQDPILKKSAVSRSPYGTGATTNYTSVTSLAMDKDGNRYMSGRYKGTYDFDPGAGTLNYTSTNTGGSAGFDLFITKLDKNDNLIWAKVIGTTNDNEFVRNMTVDNNGNVIVTGVFREDMDFDPNVGTFTMSNGTTLTNFKSMFMMKLNTNGDFLWAKNFQANTADGFALSVNEISVDASNNIMVSGNFTGTIDFDPNAGSVVVTSSNTGSRSDVFFLKMDASGNYGFYKKYGLTYDVDNNGIQRSTLNEFGYSSVADASGNIYFLFVVATTTPANKYTILHKYSPTGVQQWQNITTNPTSNGITYLKAVLDKLGNVFISASSSVVKINSSGATLWAKPIKGFNIGIDNNNNIIKTGNLSSGDDFDPGPTFYTITLQNSFSDALLSKMDNDGNFIYAKGLGASGNSNAAIIRQNITSYGDIQVWGYFDNSIDVDPSASTKTLTNTTGLTSPGFWATYSQTPCTGSPTLSSTNATACNSYRWPTKAVTYTASGIYKDTLTNAVGCDSIITLNLTINPLPSISLSNNNGTILTCVNPSTTVTSSGASTYAWTGTGGFTASTAAATISATGMYVVTGTSSLGCTATASVVITEDKVLPPAVNISYSRTSIDCINPTALLYANNSPGSTFSWTGSGGFTATGYPITVSAGGVYTVTAMGTNGCTVTATSVNIVSNKTAPTVAITPTSAILTCTTPSTNITASGANTYSWMSSNGGFSNSNATVSITIAGTYTVTGTNSTSGCTASASVIITEDKAVPTITVTPTTAVLTCPNPTANLSASGGGSYLWTRGAGGFTATTATITVSTADNYTVKVTAANGCSATKLINVTNGNITPPNVYVNPSAPVNLNCTNPYLQAYGDIGVTGMTYSWTGPGGFTSTTGIANVTTTGTYTVVATNSSGCTSTLNRTVLSIDKTPPTITVTPSSAVLTCTNPSVSLTASGVNANTIGWSGTGGYVNSGATVSINFAGTYTISGTGTNGCTATISVVISENKTPPVITIIPTSAVLTCANSSQSLMANGGISYVWTRSGGGFSATTPSVSVTTPDTYFATGTDANGCTSLGSINVTQNITVPSTSLNHSTTILTCTTPSISITANAVGSYAWTSTGGFTATTAIINVTTPATYAVTITGSNGCTASTSVVITENKTLPTVSVTPIPANGSLNCTNASMYLSGVSNGATYAWSKTGGGLTTTGVSAITVNTPGTYTLTVGGSNGCTASASAIVTQDVSPPFPTVNLTSSSISCTNPSTTITASGGNTYLWAGPSNFISTSAVVSINYPGTYIVTATGTNNCTASTTVVIANNQILPIITITPTTTVLNCANPSTTLTASGGNTYAWTGPSGFTATSASINISVGGTYIITATGTNGCSASVSRIMTEDKALPPLLVSPANPILTCTNSTTTLTASGASTYSWTGTGGFTASTATATISTVGTYIVTATGSNGCTASTSVVVTENKALPTITITPTSVALTCINSSVTVAAVSTGSTFLWASSNGGFTSTSSSITVTTAGTYTVTSGGGNSGCTASASVVVTGSNTIPPPITITANPANAIITCTKPYVDLNASVMNTYSWVGPGGFVSSNGSISPSLAGVYTLTGTAINGCIATASITLTENKVVPTVTITPTTTVLTCLNPTLILTASGSGNSTYSWRGDPFVGAIVSPTLTITVAGSFSLQATADNGCKSSPIFFTITENKTLPTVSISSNIASNVLNCINPSRTLTASGESTYAWTGVGGFTATTAAVTVSVAGTYIATATGTNGCSATTSITLIDNTAPPTVTVMPTSAVLTCSNPSTTLTASGGVSYEWTGPSGFTSSTDTPTITTAGTYVVTATRANGCTASVSVVVSGSNALPTVTLTPATTVLDCNNPSVVLTASGGASYAWTGPGGFTSNTALGTINSAGTYVVTVTGSNGCTASISRTITDNTTPPTIVVTPTSTILNCANPSLTLTASGGATYKWYFSGILISSSATINVSSPATYLVTTTGANGCTNFKNVVVTENITPPTITVTPTSAILTCTNPSTTITASGGSSYSWTGTGGFTTTTASATISSAGTYVVTGTSVNGCTATASVIITDNIGAVPRAPTILPTGTITLCPPATSVILMASGCAGGTISWNTSPMPSTGTSITVTQASSFSTTCTTTCGISPVSATTTVSTVCSCSLNISLATGNWSTTNNWSCGHVPLATEPVQISSGHTITLDVNGAAKSLDLRGILNQQATKILTIKGN
jgi:hypothetical protein